VFKCHYMVYLCVNTIKGIAHSSLISFVRHFVFRKFRMFCVVSEHFYVGEVRECKGVGNNGECLGISSILLGVAFCRSIIIRQGEGEMFLVVLYFNIFTLEGGGWVRGGRLLRVGMFHLAVIVCATPFHEAVRE
jgi:hypothetical protein